MRKKDKAEHAVHKNTLKEFRDKQGEDSAK